MMRMVKISGITGLLLVLAQLIVSAAEWEHYILTTDLNHILHNNEKAWFAGNDLYVYDADQDSYRCIEMPYPIMAIGWENDESLIVSTADISDIVDDADVYRYHLKADSLSKFDVPDGIDKLFVRQIVRDGNGVVWCSAVSFREFYILQGDNFELYTDETWPPEGYSGVKSMAVAPDGTLWISYNCSPDSRSVVAYYDGATWIQVFDLPKSLVNDLTFTGDGNLWFYTALTGTIHRFDGDEEINYVISPDKTIHGQITATDDHTIWWTGNRQIVRFSHGILEDMTDDFISVLNQELDNPSYFSWSNVTVKSDTVWVRISFENEKTNNVHLTTLTYYIDNTWHIYPDPNFIYPFASDSPSEIAVDRHGTVWFGAFNWTSDYLITPQPVASFGYNMWTLDDNNNASYGVVADAQNRIWLTNGYKNHYLLDGNVVECQSFSTSVRKACATATTVWAGDNEGNLYRLDGNCSWTRFDAPDTSIGHIRAIAADDKYGVWVGGVDGIAHFDGVNWTVYDEAGRPFPGAANGVAIDSQGVAWFATNAGLFSFDGVSWVAYTTANSLLPDNEITSVLVAADNSLFVGTAHGLIRIANGGWEVFTHDNSPVKRVGNMAAAPDVSVWILTDGLVHYIPDILIPVGIDATDQHPAAFRITGNHPNPFNPATTIEFSLDTGSFVTLDIYSITGQHVRSLTAEYLAAGVHSVVWDGTGNSGAAVASGIYFARVQSGGRTAVHRMVLVR